MLLKSFWHNYLEIRSIVTKKMECLTNYLKYFSRSARNHQIKLFFFFVNESTWRHYAWPHYGDNPF